ncbi:DUF3515 domain-containing protein [Streptomyces harbinensis]|uniref:DUF3515 domain-containing protein n=1 Tax=Streptomyces harbinensis TaxID=1176198 RepID=A0A1I6VU41_9ACTN|nr:DUF3515 domain-containing protein [Streptomyces harbinensis]SFT17242.1 Protein of unknown function [Streptomyces harbinensis]
MSRTVRFSGTVLAASAVLLALVGCAAADGTDGAAAVVAPAPAAAAAEVCDAVDAALPERVEGQERVDGADLPAYVAVWGDPAIVLRCGVPLPLVLTPGEEGYDPLADAVDVNGVSWLLEDAPGGGKLFTTTHRTVHVEVSVPADYAPEVNPLVDLAEAIAGQVPLDELYAQEELYGAPPAGS